MAVPVPSRGKVLARAVRILWLAARFFYGWSQDQKVPEGEERRRREIARRP